MLSARNRELLALVPAAMLVTAGFAAIFIQADNRISTVSLTYGAFFLALCLFGHVVIRRALPNADPYLFPLAAALASIGIVMLYRIDPTLARQQAQWMIVGLVLFAITIVVYRGGRYLRARELPLPDRDLRARQHDPAAAARHRRRRSTAPTWRCTSGRSRSSRRSSGRSRLVIFLASYLRDNRQLLVTAGRRVLGVTIPPMKQFGPLLLVWGSAMALLLVTREIGTSLMFFGALPGAAVRRDGPGVVPVRRAAAVRRRRLLPGDARRAHPRPRDRVAAPVRPEALPDDRLPARERAVRAGRRRPARRRLRPVDHPQRPRGADPGRRQRLDLRRDHRRDRARRRGRRCS